MDIGKPFDSLPKGPLRTIGGQVTLLVTFAVLTTALFISFFFYIHTSKIAFDAESHKLAAEVKLTASVFETAFINMQHDVITIARTPPINGIIRSTRHNGIDPVDHSTLSLWRERLETIFTSMLSVKSSYVQIRYIGIDNGGREIVRVNKSLNGDIEAVPENKLQNKAGEFYFKDILNTDKDKIYFSAVSLNRENRKVQHPFLPVIRAAMPIYDDTDKKFGMIVINASYEQILKDILQNLKTDDKQLYALNEKGDYIYYDAGSQNAHFHYRTMAKGTPFYDTLHTQLSSSENEGFVDVKDNSTHNIFYFQKLYFNPDNPEQFLMVAMSLPLESILQPVNRIKIQTLYLTLLLTTLALVIASVFTWKQMSPLRRMTKNIKSFRDDTTSINLPVTLRNEIGALARAFDALIRRLNAARTAEEDALLKMQSIVDKTVDGIITIDKSGIIKTYNKSCEKIFGYKAKDTIGSNIKMLMPEPYYSQHDEYLSNYHKTGKSGIIGVGREVEGRREDGSIFPLDLAISEVKLGDETIYVGIIRDITERKQAEEEIMRSNQELEHFAYVASHDLREPLRMVSNFTELLEKEYADKLDQDGREYMRFILQGSQRMQNLITDLLEYSRLRSEHQDFQEFDSRAQVDLAIANMGKIINDTHAKITIGPLPIIRANPIQFVRLMQNLISNAIKYRHPERQPEIKIEALEQEHEWMFSVKDNGIGMKEEYLQQIFVIFKRLHNKDEYYGTGIGLAVCKKIVESLYGKIWVESDYGDGSCFYFTVPKPRTERTENDEET